MKHQLRESRAPIPTQCKENTGYKSNIVHISVLLMYMLAHMLFHKREIAQKVKKNCQGSFIVLIN